ncbi:t-SNARE [Eremomyces bilateralis CBS 781.70]|uniref:t-SNARE n=1 Tax=Eremomyces bilateralis CBS 781.70 TaxID=1392243 RepID=A0A6G1GB06_9PEZI|nr:t-SNARE [Eremomyces bilateralis CBS 781.70]KAF1815255.1 t-SNARE [Eremomyces bilateralis CBS 781.70]
MSYGGQQQSYGQYGGNPYGSENEGYGGGYGGSNPYGDSPNPSGNNQAAAPGRQPDLAAYDVNPGQTGSTRPNILSDADFLERIQATKGDINTLSTQISNIATMHQRALSSTDSTMSQQIDTVVENTQVLNSQIKDQIKFLETDAVRSGDNKTKHSQVRNLKQQFKQQLEEFQREESTYRQRYKDAIARQYRIVNPTATEDEVQEAADADWGNEGVFQTALRSNRQAHASSVLGAVRARHNDIQRIERTLGELAQLFQDLAEAVVVQDQAVAQVEEQTDKVRTDVEGGNKQLDSGIRSARRARKMKWWCLGICVLIVVILALVLGLYFGVGKGSSKNNNQ